MAAAGIRFEGTAFWVRHRHREYGPFDYEWARDLSGIELLYGRSKFGEFCSEDEVCADLREFKLPMRVVEVTSIVCGSIIVGILSGMPTDDRYELVRQHLNDRGLDRFADNIEGWVR
ncbi:hypothetical protein GC176_14365 [bacterium]|nr:hypothetical protein [bacterium]